MSMSTVQLSPCDVAHLSEETQTEGNADMMVLNSVSSSVSTNFVSCCQLLQLKMQLR